MTNNIDILQTAELLSQKDNILLLCHKNPDGDTLGSAAGLCHALSDMGKSVRIYCVDTIPAKYDFMNIPLYSEGFKVDYSIAVDVAGQKLLGDKVMADATAIDLCIDHHGSNSGYTKNLCCYPDHPATAQLIYDILTAMNAPISQLTADCLYTGIITDTGCYKYSSTTPETLITGAKLMELGARHTFITDRFFMSKTKKNIQLEKYVLNNLEYYFDEHCAFIALTQDVLDEIQPEITDIDGISALPRNIEGVDVAITVRPIKDCTYKISIRTGENADACAIAHGLGGGGHIRAAGCEVMGSLESAKKAILKEVEQALCR